MLGKLLRVGAAGAALALMAAAGPPWVLSQSSAEISLRWYPDTTPSALAEGVAQAHCAAMGRAASLVNAELDGSAEIASYACR